MIHEDLLLSRIDILENKLSCYQKNITNEKLQEQINELQDEKEVYQVSTANYVKLELNQWIKWSKCHFAPLHRKLQKKP